MTIEWNKVTWYSKLLAVLLFTLTFWVAFCLGFQYKEILSQNSSVIPGTDNVGGVTSGDVRLGVGQSKTIGGLGITLVSVLGDSRCPTDVQCIWSGNVNTKITLYYNDSAVTRELASDSLPITFSEFNISIKSVTPVPNTKQQINPADYKVNFHIEKISQI